ncbi:MAG: type II toxin-antitoxin system HipA family toxin [Holosporaceae bacterium]|jgi:serine/threonine-protein kinase HipA|nr:type II toxin-antitoxin system HipA family toxin [Holosporaceae bacterium]
MIKELNIFLNIGNQRRQVGQLIFQNRRYYFEYSVDFIKSDLQISPFLLPLKTGVFTCDENNFSNPFGVFNDSMPDGWGMLLLSQKLKKQNIDIHELSFLEKLSIVGRNGMGALEYEPFVENQFSEILSSPDILSKESNKVLNGEDSDFIELMLKNSGSSCGARPKITTDINGESWIIKLISSMDDNDAGITEYAYSLAAKKAGINMPETRLFQSEKYPGFFGTKRFDRKGKCKIHMHSACGLLNADFRTPSLEYEHLITATKQLTKNVKEAEQIFRIMVFNVKTHNLDDHSKNFSFLMDENEKWSVSPAYDLTYSRGIYGHRMTGVNGKTKDITDKDILTVAKKCGIEGAENIIDEVCLAAAEIGEAGKMFKKSCF